MTQSHGGSSVASIPHYVSLDFAYATQRVLYVICGIMAVAGVVAVLGLRRGRQDLPADAESVVAGASPGTA